MTGTNMKWLSRGLAVLFLVFGIFMLVRACGNNAKKEFKKEAAEPGTDFRSIIDSKNREIALQAAKIVENQETINTLLGENTKLKNAKAVVEYEQKVTVREVPVPFAVKDTLADTNKITVPKNFTKTDKWFSLAGKVTKKGVDFDSIDFTISGRIGLGFKKPENIKQIFKPELTAELQSDNPNARTKKMETYYLDEKRKWYQKPTTWLGVGFGLGVGTAIAIFAQ